MPLIGIQATHQPSPWIGDYGHFCILPHTHTSGDPSELSSQFSHEEQESRPYYYRVLLKDFDVGVEVTATSRCGVLRLQFPEGQPAFLNFDVYQAGSIELDSSSHELHGVARSNHGGVAGDFGCRFVARVDCPIREVSYSKPTDESAPPRRATVALDVPPSRTVVLKIGTSFVSDQQARENLRQEVGDLGFAEVKSKMKQEWNRRLSAIRIEGASQDQLVTFYSCLYRTLLYPRTMHEQTAAGELIHYSPYSGKIEAGELYTDNGFWDTFRAVYPLFTILDPRFDASTIRGWINAYREGGWFPKWASPGYRDCMIGTHVESLVADALAKGIDDFDKEAAFAACLRDATVASDWGGVGREGLEFYDELGYVPSDRVPEATARTLEFAYDDWCVAQVAQRMGETQHVAPLLKRAQNYRNVFDPNTGFMRGRLSDGNWRTPFAEDEWGGPFTEASAWHYSWSVLHDVRGLIELMGGDQPFIEKLNQMLDSEPTFGIGSYGHEIHEMTEMVAGGMGQYAHGNQPVHHVLYLYNFAGAPWRAAQPIRQVVDELYGPGPDGYMGDEDNGQMSAWYVFSALGFYPVCPGKPGYVIGTPRFEKATIRIPGSQPFVIEAENNSDSNIYVQSVSLNGKALHRSWLSHDEITAGGTLKFVMGPQPNKTWGSSPENRPFVGIDSDSAQ